MKHLASTIETIFRVDSRGGKLIERDSNVIMLYDYPRISHDAIQIITDQFPSVVVNTMSCSSSRIQVLPLRGYDAIQTMPMTIPQEQDRGVYRLDRTAYCVRSVTSLRVGASSPRNA